MISEKILLLCIVLDSIFCISATGQRKKSKERKKSTLHCMYYTRTECGNLAWIFAALTEELSGMGLINICMQLTTCCRPNSLIYNKVAWMDGWMDEEITECCVSDSQGI